MIAKPVWLRRRILSSDRIDKTRRTLRDLSLNTVCESANCPNLCECFERGAATFIIMGSVCTRGCRFCAVKAGAPEAVDIGEPMRISEAVERLGLRYIVITSVTRDDLPDRGARHYADVVERLRKEVEGIDIEVLTPDFDGKKDLIDIVYKAGIDVFAHNLDTVRRLHKKVKPNCDYEVSLTALKIARSITKDVSTKSGLMLGLGETEDEVFATMKDLRTADCDIITLGQYLKPAGDCIPEAQFVSPKTFEKYEEMAYNLTFKNVSAGPFVRSSYHLVC